MSKSYATAIVLSVFTICATVFLILHMLLEYQRANMTRNQFQQQMESELSGIFGDLE